MRNPDVMCEYCCQAYYANQCIINSEKDIVCPDCHSRTAAVSRMDPKPRRYELSGALAFVIICAVLWGALCL